MERKKEVHTAGPGKAAALELYLSPSDNYRITDQDGKEYTPEEAKALSAAGKITNCNMAFGRLSQFDFSIEATRDYYAEQNRLHAQRRCA